MIRVLPMPVLFLCAVLPCNAAFAEEQTEPERLSEQLQELPEGDHRSLSKRWDGLIRRRQWTSASGKHKTYAKYLDHDPDLSWVKLLVLIKSGEEQTEKETQVPLEKLDKKGQSLVRRIALTRKEVDEALGSSRATEKRQDNVAEQYPTGKQRNSQDRETRDTRPEERSPPNPNEPILPDDAPWRKNYEKFIGNLSATKIDPNGDENDLANWQLEWGELQDIRRVWESLAYRPNALSGESARQEPLQARRLPDESRARVGEVIWEGVLKKKIRRQVAVEFEIPEPTKPFDITFILDKDQPGDWERFRPGEKVRFIGRFESFGVATPTMIVSVRFPDEQPGARASGIMARRLPPGLEDAIREKYGTPEE